MSVSLINETLKIAAFAGLSLAGILVIHIASKNQSRKISYLRIFIQAISEIVLFYLIAYPLWLGLVLATVFLMTFFVGRFFCGWICPFGFYMDLASFLRQAFKKRYLTLPEKINRNLHRLRYVILVVILGLPFVLTDSSGSFASSSLRFLSGPLNPLRILLAPLVPMIAPWKTLYGSNINSPYLDQIVHYSSGDFVLVTMFVFFALTVLSSFVVRRFWCRFCPTGASAAVANRFRGFKWTPLLHLEKEEEKCTKCGICKRACTVQVTDVYEQKGGKIATSMCMLCLRCVEMCPYEGCLKLKVGEKPIFKSRNWLEPSFTQNSEMRNAEEKTLKAQPI
jgi:ferredoxin-type protein NapH